MDLKRKKDGEIIISGFGFEDVLKTAITLKKELTKEVDA